MTLKERIKVVFRDLRRNGFIARMNLEKSDEDARNIILDEYNKSNKNAPRAVFFTKLDITNNQTNIKYFHLKNDKEKEVEIHYYEDGCKTTYTIDVDGDIDDIRPQTMDKLIRKHKVKQQPYALERNEETGWVFITLSDEQN